MREFFNQCDMSVLDRIMNINFYSGVALIKGFLPAFLKQAERAGRLRQRAEVCEGGVLVHTHRCDRIGSAEIAPQISPCAFDFTPPSVFIYK